MADYTETQHLEVTAGYSQVQGLNGALGTQDELMKVVAAGAARMAAATNTVTTASADAASAHRQWAAVEHEVYREMERLTAMAWHEAEAEKAVTASTTQLAAAHGRLATASTGATSKVAGIGYAMRDVGRMTQDFAQGGMAGIINNIEQFTSSLGGGAGLGGALTLVGVAALIATPHVKAWYQEMTGGNNKIPETADALARLNDRISEGSKKLQEYREKQKLTNVEVVEYNKLSRQQIELEKQKNEEAEKRNILAGLDALMPKERRERIAGFNEAVGEAGGRDRAESTLRQALENTGMEWEEANKRAEELMIEGARGFKDSIEEIRQVIRRGIRDEKQQKFADEIQANTPEARKGREKNEAKEKAEKENQDADDALVKMLNAQAQHNEDAWRREQGAAARKLGAGELRQKNKEDHERDVSDAKGGAEFNRQVNDATKTVAANSDVDEQAAAMAARLRAQGRGSNREQFNAVAKAVGDRLRAAGWHPMVAGMVGNNVADSAFKEVDTRVMGRQAELTGAGMDAVSATQQAMAEVLNVQTMIAQQAAVLQAQGNNLQQQFARLSQAIGGGNRARPLARRAPN